MEFVIVWHRFKYSALTLQFGHRKMGFYLNPKMQLIIIYIYSDLNSLENMFLFETMIECDIYN